MYEHDLELRDYGDRQCDKCGQNFIIWYARHYDSDIRDNGHPDHSLDCFCAECYSKETKEEQK